MEPNVFDKFVVVVNIREKKKQVKELDKIINFRTIKWTCERNKS